MEVQSPVGRTFKLKKLKAALEVIDIKLLDHFIIGKGEIVSLAGMGKL